jgi:hypothetical protein
MSNVVWIKEWLRRKGDRERRKHWDGRCWYPSRNEKGELEWEQVYGVPKPVCVHRPSKPQWIEQL